MVFSSSLFLFYFLPADMVTQILNFGIPAPVDIQIAGKDVEASRRVANHVLGELRQVAGIVDARVQQQFDYPTLRIAVERTKAAQAGLSERDVAESMLNTLSGSGQVTAMKTTAGATKGTLGAAQAIKRPR